MKHTCIYFHFDEIAVIWDMRNTNVFSVVIFLQSKWHWALLRSVMENGIHNVSFGHRQIQSAGRKSRFSQSWWFHFAPTPDKSPRAMARTSPRVHPFLAHTRDALHAHYIYVGACLLGKMASTVSHASKHTFFVLHVGGASGNVCSSACFDKYFSCPRLRHFICRRRCEKRASL